MSHTISHLLRAMRAGDVIYLADEPAGVSRQVTSVAFRNDGEVETTIFLAVNLDPAVAHRICRVKMIKPLRGKLR